MEKTAAQFQEELDRERVFSKLSNTKILELLSKQKEIQDEYEEKILQIHDKHENEVAALKVAVTQATEAGLRAKDEAHQEQVKAMTAQFEEKIRTMLGQHQREMDLIESRWEEKLAEQLQEKDAFYQEKLKEMEAVAKPVKNQRGAGRKRVATQETIDMVLKLRATGVSYVKISEVLKERLGVELGRTTVGEIVRGSYKADGDDQMIS